jgi:hypothetical protein
MSVPEDDPAIMQQSVFEELRNREPIFHHPEFGTSKADYERMTAGDFWEVGASGRIYDRRHVIDILAKRYSEPFEDIFRLEGCKCRQLAQDIWLFTYTRIKVIVSRGGRRSGSNHLMIGKLSITKGHWLTPGKPHALAPHQSPQ